MRCRLVGVFDLQVEYLEDLSAVPHLLLLDGDEGGARRVGAHVVRQDVAVLDRQAVFPVGNGRLVALARHFARRELVRQDDFSSERTERRVGLLLVTDAGAANATSVETFLEGVLTTDVGGGHFLKLL
ncbi:MAG: hypothetical protein RLZZ480_700 [Candidatus Parcubacteria bacterium]